MIISTAFSIKSKNLPVIPAENGTASSKTGIKTPIKIALSYPDVYEIGMSNMALPILYDILNAQPDVLAERVFPPWVDMAKEMKRTASRFSVWKPNIR